MDSHVRENDSFGVYVILANAGIHQPAIRYITRSIYESSLAKIPPAFAGAKVEPPKPRLLCENSIESLNSYWWVVDSGLSPRPLYGDTEPYNGSQDEKSMYTILHIHELFNEKMSVKYKISITPGRILTFLSEFC